MITRRGLLSSILALSAAPAIVRAESLMPIRVPSILLPENLGDGDFTIEGWMMMEHSTTFSDSPSFIDEVTITRGAAKYALPGTAVLGILSPRFDLFKEFVFSTEGWHRCVIERGPNGLRKSMHAA